MHRNNKIKNAGGRQKCMGLVAVPIIRSNVGMKKKEYCPDTGFKQQVGKKMCLDIANLWF